MKRWAWMFLAVAPLLAQRHDDDRNWRVEDKESLSRTLDVS